MENEGIAAILWDYDGTLADSGNKNIEVTLGILRRFYPDIDSHLPETLTSKAAYQDALGRYPDWKEFYRTVFSLSDEQVAESGRLSLQIKPKRKFSRVWLKFLSSLST